MSTVSCIIYTPSYRVWLTSIQWKMPASLGTGASFTLKPFQIQVFREKESVNDIIQKGERGWENGKKRERRRNDNRCLEMLVSLQFLLY